MKKIVVNINNLKESDITESSKRVKALIIDSKQEILLAYSHHEYQFPGGHVKEKESLLNALKRELKEEVGVSLDVSNLKPFIKRLAYWKDWPEKGKNRKIEIYYYIINGDIKPNLENTDYTEDEKLGEFSLSYTSLDNVEEVIKNNALKYGDKLGIAKEMLEIITYYKKGK